MRLIEKALLGLTAIGTAGAIGAAAMQGIASEQKAIINTKTNNLKATSGYVASNFEYKNNQITKIMQEYSLGLLSEEDLVNRIKEENLNELDFDTYAKTHFDDVEYQRYLKLKEDTAQNDELHKVLPNVMIASITLIGMAVGVFTCKEIDEKRKQKHRDNQTHQC